MQPKKKKLTCDGYYMIQDRMGDFTPDWCDGTIKHNQSYISISINDGEYKTNWHDCKTCHEYIKVYELDLVEA